MIIKFKNIPVGGYFLIEKSLYLKIKNGNGLGEAISIGIVNENDELLISSSHITVYFDPENFYKIIKSIKVIR